MAPKYSNDINHPVQIGWSIHNQEPEEERVKELLVRFNYEYRHIESEARGFRLVELLDKVADAESRVNANRQLHEAWSRTKLRLDDITPYKPDSADERSRFEVYSSLAGRPEKIGRFIEWFTELAPEFFAMPTAYNGLAHTMDTAIDDEGGHGRAIGLELGGMRQIGDWLGTGRIDAMAQNIPRQVRTLYPDADIKILEGETVQKGYSIEPLATFSRERNPYFSYALVRRRRKVAEITLPYRPSVEIKKESSALLLVNQMDTEDKIAVRHFYKRARSVDRELGKHSVAAVIAGHVFERAIQETREESSAIVPISAHYYMVMEQPTEDR